ncbi:MAG: GNAT family N-acetyltransferase [Chloroflexi bacterium]|nr:GNAT family N-acetyltransferase [Chloroflexota bacterium]
MKILFSRQRHLQARLRYYLPSWAGGRFKAHEIDHKVLDESHIVQLISLYRQQHISKIKNYYLTLLQSNLNFGVGIFLDDQLVAAAWVTPQWQQLEISGHWIGAFVVRYDLRGRGLGQHTLRYTLAEATRRGIDLIYANCWIENKSSLGALYATGFKRIARPDWEKKLKEHLDLEQIVGVYSVDEDRHQH